MDMKDAPGFSAIALDHGTAPRNFGPLEDWTGHARITGLCEDTMEFWIRVAGGVLERVSFVTEGCRASAACGSMTTCLAEGRALDEALGLWPDEILTALGGVPEKAAHCATLAARTLHAACHDHLTRTAGAEERPDDNPEENRRMRIAIPMAGEDVPAPPHQPGLLPVWLAERGAEVIVAGGMGQRAHALFADRGIRVVVGAPAAEPEKIVADYIAGTLQVGENICDH